MSFPDDVIMKAFEYLTRIPMDELSSMEKALEKGENPMTLKKRLAFEIVKLLNTQHDADSAQEAFETTVQRGETPLDMKEVTLNDDDNEFVDEDLLVQLNIASSKADAKRLFQQGGVEVNGEKIMLEKPVSVTDGMTLKVGKRAVLKLRTP